MATKSLLYGAVLIVAVGLAVSTSESLSGPCKEWIRNDCLSQRWVCTSVEDFERNNLGPQLACPITSEPPTPPPGQCRLVNGVCQYAEPPATCDIWVPDGDYRYICGTVEERARAMTDTNVVSSDTPPTPDMLCIPVNDTCQWYNPCRYWRGHCLSGYRCGTAEEYYRFLFGPHPLCALPPEGWVEPQPPGECVVQDGECGWSNCVAYLGWCQYNWNCGTQYDQAVYLSSPPPPCPAPPPNYTPPPPPGECQFDVPARECQFQAGETTPTPVTTGDCLPGSEDCIIPEDACVLGLVICLPNHRCHVWPSNPLRASCIRMCASNNGGCGQGQECVERPFCYLCELRTVMNGYCEDHGERIITTTAPNTIGAAVTTVQGSAGSESHGALGIIGVVGIVVGVVAGLSVVLIVVMCTVAILAHYEALKEDRVSNTYNKDDNTEERNTKYAELKFQDSVSESSSLEKEDLSSSTLTEEKKENDYIV